MNCCELGRQSELTDEVFEVSVPLGDGVLLAFDEVGLVVDEVDEEDEEEDEDEDGESTSTKV
jgi:hypothetical protein